MNEGIEEMMTKKEATGATLGRFFCRNLAVAAMVLAGLSAGFSATFGGPVGVAYAQDDARLGPFSEVDPEEGTAERVGQLELRLFDFTYVFDGTSHHYLHKRKFDEVGGIGMTVMRAKVCVDEGRQCVSGLTAYRVEGNGTLLQSNHRISTERDHDVFTVEYWSLDDFGNQQYFKATLQTNGEDVRVIY